MNNYIYSKAKNNKYTNFFQFCAEIYISIYTWVPVQLNFCFFFLNKYCGLDHLLIISSQNTILIQVCFVQVETESNKNSNFKRLKNERNKSCTVWANYEKLSYKSFPKAVVWFESIYWWSHAQDIHVFYESFFYSFDHILKMI